MFGRKPLKSDKPHALWVYAPPKALIVRSSRPLAQILDSADARARRAKAREILARQIGAPATARALGEFRQIRAEVAGARKIKNRTINVALALAGVASILFVGIPGVLPGAMPGVLSEIPNPGWSGVEIYRPSSTPQSATVRFTLPAVPRRRVGGNSMDSFWIGADGNPNFGPIGEWLPQAGWDVTPAPGVAGMWSISPWAIVCHSVGNRAQFPGYNAAWSVYVPAGTMLTASMTFGKGHIEAILTASSGLTVKKRLPQLPGEPAQFSLVEGVLEAPGAGDATATMTLQNTRNMRLIATGPIPMTLSVKYAKGSRSSDQPGVYPMAIDQPGHWANSTTTTRYRAQNSSVVASATIVGRKADGIGDWVLGALYGADNFLASVL